MEFKDQVYWNVWRLYPDERNYCGQVLAQTHKGALLVATEQFGSGLIVEPCLAGHGMDHYRGNLASIDDKLRKETERIIAQVDRYEAAKFGASPQ